MPSACGDEQLEPAVAEQDEPGHAAAEGEEDRGADRGVEADRALQQAGLADDLRHLGVGAGHRGESLVARVGLSNRP